jgi:hypothetical protein
MGPPATVHVTLSTPTVPFDAPPYASISAALPTTLASLAEVPFDLSVVQEGFISLYDLLDGGTPVHVELKGVS